MQRKTKKARVDWRKKVELALHSLIIAEYILSGDGEGLGDTAVPRKRDKQGRIDAAMYHLQMARDILDS